MKKKIEELFRLAMKAQDDGWYEMDMFYPDERSEKEYQKAKEHLIRLLRSKRKAATA